MHIEPGVVSSAKIGMGYTTAAVALALTAHRARQGARSNGGWLPLLLLFGAGATAIGLATGLLTQGLFFAPADLPQYGMNVTTLLLPLYGVRLLARRIIPAQDVRSEPVELARFDRPTPGLPSTGFPSPRAGPQDAPPCFGAAPRPENRVRTANVNVQAVLAQAQTKLSGTPQQTPSSDGTSDTEKVGKLYLALAGVHQRIATQSQTASASLSALGKFKSDLFNLGTAAKNLASLPATSTPQAIQSGLQQLVSAYNASLKSSGAMSTAGSDSGAGISRAQRELRAAVDNAAAASGALHKIGVVRKPDGSLSLDTGALTKALTQDRDGAVTALTGMVKSMSGIASRTLADDSRLNTSLARLGDRAQALKAQQAAVVSTATQLAELGSSGNSWNAMAVAAYRRV